MIPECKTFLEELVIPEELLHPTKDVKFEDVNEIYRLVAPSWDGTDELFDVESFADAALLPKLKSIVGEAGILLADDADDQAEAGGIVLEEPT